MSANVETIRRGYEAWNRNDMERALRDIDPDIEWRPRLGAAGVRATLYRGHDGVLVYKREIRGGARCNRGRRAFDRGSRRSRSGSYPRPRTGYGKRVRVEAEGFHLGTMQGGRAVGFTTYERRDEALEAAGLRE